MSDKPLPLITADFKPGHLEVNGLETIPASAGRYISDYYKAVFATPYPKFHKMDILCKVSVICAEAALAALPSFVERTQPSYLAERSHASSEEVKSDMDIIAFSVDGCLASDMAYTDTLRPDEFFPSPAVFVYTLPNILTGEIAIRHKCRGETSLYAVRSFNDKIIDKVLTAYRHKHTRGALLAIMADAKADNDFHVHCDLFIDL